MDLHRAFNNVHNAIETMFAARGLDYAFGARLPHLLQEHQLEIVSIENDAPFVAGSSPQARMMAMSATLLAKAYVATGFARPEDISRYGSFANDASCWATYHATIRAIARKPLLAATTRPRPRRLPPSCPYVARRCPKPRIWMEQGGFNGIGIEPS